MYGRLHPTGTLVPLSFWWQVGKQSNLLRARSCHVGGQSGLHSSVRCSFGRRLVNASLTLLSNFDCGGITSHFG